MPTIYIPVYIPVYILDIYHTLKVVVAYASQASLLYTSVEAEAMDTSPHYLTAEILHSDNVSNSVAHTRHSLLFLE
jgi:hypothetical protein